MTLLDLFRLLRRYLAIVIALPAICAAAAGVYFYVLPGNAADNSFASSEARIVASSQLPTVAGLASSEAKTISSEFPGVSVETKGEASTMTVTITAKGPDPEACAEAANAIAEQTVETAKSFYSETSQIDNAVNFEAQIEYAKPGVASSASSGGKSKYLLVGLFAGLFVAICIVVVIDLVRRPVKSIEDVQEAVELPVLEKLPVIDSGERLLANVRFASKKDVITSVCVIPVSVDAGAEESAAALEAAAAAEGSELEVTRCQSLAHGMSGAYVAQDADATVLTVNQWTDSRKTLESTVAELRLADANLVGIVFGKEIK